MIFKTEFCDLSNFLRSGIQPSILIKRPKLGGPERQAPYLHAKVNGTGKFWVPGSSIQPGEDPNWAYCDTGDHVSSLFHAYLTPSVSPATIWPCGIQTGVMAIESFRDTTNEEPEVVYMFCGREVFEKNGKLQCLLALAIRVKD